MRLASLSLCGLLVAACGDSGVTVETNEDNFCDEIAEVACHNLYQCCTEGEIESHLGVDEPRTELQCRDDAKRLCERNYVGVRDSIKEGRVSFDPAKLNACLTAYVAPDGACSTLAMELPWTMPCKEASFVGQVAVGGTCLFSFDCAGAPNDTYCGSDQKCKAKPTAGFPCAGGCARGFYCGTNNTCAQRVALGAPCLTTSQCAENLFCDTSAIMPVCAEPKPGGEACTSPSGCKSGDCVPGKCGTSNQECYTDATCGKRCGGTGISCNTPANCGNGTCSNVGGTCNDFTTCPTGSTCIYTTDCLPVDCVGDPVCTLEYVAVDYCEAITQSSMF